MPLYQSQNGEREIQPLTQIQPFLSKETLITLKVSRRDSPHVLKIPSGAII